MNSHESDDQYSRMHTDRRVLQVLEDLRDALRQGQEDLAYAEREVARLNEEIIMFEYLYRLSGLARDEAQNSWRPRFWWPADAPDRNPDRNPVETISVTDTSGYSQSSYTETDA